MTFSSTNNAGRKKALSNMLPRIIALVILIFFAVATLFPIYFMFISSFGEPVQSGTVAYSLVLQKFTLDSYKFFFNFSPYSFRWLLNSVIVASIVTLTNVFFAAMAGYAFAKLQFRGSKVIFIILLCGMMIPYQVTQVPLYVLVVNVFHIQNTYWALILPDLCLVYNVFLAKQFMSSLPTSIIESAKLEGCNQLMLFVKIIVPLSKTLLAVIAILTFMGEWNTFFWPLLVTNSESMYTIQIGLQSFRFKDTSFFAPMMAGATVAAVPMFVLFFSLQKYFLEGVTVGAVKG